MGEAGSVAHMFDRKGFITVEKSKVDEDRLIEVALDAGADDVSSEEPDVFEVYTPPTAVLRGAAGARGGADSHRLGRALAHPAEYRSRRAREKEAEQILRIMELIEDHDDVQKVWSNFDIPAGAAREAEPLSSRARPRDRPRPMRAGADGCHG